MIGLHFKLIWKYKLTSNPSVVFWVLEENVLQILCHQGVVWVQLLWTIQERLFCPNMFEKVPQSCHQWQTTKVGEQLPKASFSCVPADCTPLDHISMISNIYPCPPVKTKNKWSNLDTQSNKQFCSSTQNTPLQWWCWRVIHSKLNRYTIEEQQLQRHFSKDADTAWIEGIQIGRCDAGTGADGILCDLCTGDTFIDCRSCVLDTMSQPVCTSYCLLI